jgi:cytochrome c5
MVKILYLVVCGLCIAGCKENGAESAAEPAARMDATTSVDAATTELEIPGVEAYQLVCASCHETGLNGAPMTGDTDAWSGRSSHWEAVLFEHAKGGYMDMPAKGGKTELSDRSVVAAAEYMLSITYPDRPPN